MIVSTERTQEKLCYRSSITLVVLRMKLPSEKTFSRKRRKEQRDYMKRTQVCVCSSSCKTLMIRHRKFSHGKCWQEMRDRTCRTFSLVLPLTFTSGCFFVFSHGWQKYFGWKEFFRTCSSWWQALLLFVSYSRHWCRPFIIFPSSNHCRRTTVHIRWPTIQGTSYLCRISSIRSSSCNVWFGWKNCFRPTLQISWSKWPRNSDWWKSCRINGAA